MKRIFSIILAGSLFLVSFLTLSSCASDPAQENDDAITLRVCNWEEYIDEGGWEEDELIELDNGTTIFGENHMAEDFETWYFETYGKRVNVEYSTFGTNEELYNQLTLGDSFDLACPSDYMIMKLMAEGELMPFSEAFFDESNEYNYYAKGVSPYIQGVFDSHEINGEAWSKYAAGFMWGTTGIVYNPDAVSKEDAATWQVLSNPKYKRKVTVKDNVRDTYFAALGIYKRDILMSDAFRKDPNYAQNLFSQMNDTSDETIAGIEALLKQVKENVYSFETDSGKADMVTGKIVANYQWSGDAVYTMEQAEEDGLYLNYSVPEEGSDLWFDGWVMLKDGVSESKEKQQVAEAFVNFVSRPDNVVRNMYYIGYTSAIAGGEDDTLFDYIKWYYEAGDEEEETADYDISYFFGKDSVITIPKEQLEREMFAQYPTEEILSRTTIMNYFDIDTYSKINQMWINVRCVGLSQVGVVLVCVLLALVVVGSIFLAVVLRIKMKDRKKEPLYRNEY